MEQGIHLPLSHQTRSLGEYLEQEIHPPPGHHRIDLDHRDQPGLARGLNDHHSEDLPLDQDPLQTVELFAKEDGKEKLERKDRYSTIYLSK